MSLLQDALKTAQREKSRRESKLPASDAVLVPLRSKPVSTFSWWRAFTIVGAGAAIVGASALTFIRTRKEVPLPLVPPITSAILSEAIAADSSKPANASSPATHREPTVARIGSGSPSPDTARIAAQRETTASRIVAQSSPPTTPRRAARDAAAIPQGQPATESSQQRDAQAEGGGRLRITVERPRQLEASRLFADAVAAHRAGDFATARSLYERVLVLVPSDAEALNNLGVLLSAQREFDRALGLLRRAASIAPQNAGVWNNIGTALREQGKSSDAIAAYQHALTLDPHHEGATLGLAQQYVSISALPQARALLEAVIAKSPTFAEAHYTLGQISELQGDRVGAIAAYSTFLRHAPSRLASHAELVLRRVEMLNRAP